MREISRTRLWMVSAMPDSSGLKVEVIIATFMMTRGGVGPNMMHGSGHRRLGRGLRAPSHGGRAGWSGSQGKIGPPFSPSPSGACGQRAAGAFGGHAATRNAGQATLRIVLRVACKAARLAYPARTSYPTSESTCEASLIQSSPSPAAGPPAAAAGRRSRPQCPHQSATIP